jgi:hypothetical protein
MRNEVLMGYVFHYNPYKDMWAAVPREYYLDYFNGEYDKVVFHESVNSLVKYISKEWQSQPKSE